MLFRSERQDGFSGEVKRDVYQTLAWAEQRFHAFLLQAPEAEPARTYLTERGITLDSIAKFRLGYSPNRWDWLVNEARSTEYNQKLLTSAGLVAERNKEAGHILAVADRPRGAAAKDEEPRGVVGLVLDVPGEDRHAVVLGGEFARDGRRPGFVLGQLDRKSTRLNSSH